MRLAICSNLFPPLWIGGYETGAAEVVRELRRRGHEVLLLTASSVWIQEDGRFECRRQPGFQQPDVVDHLPLVDIGPCILGSLARLPVWRIATLAFSAFRGQRGYRKALEDFAPDQVLLFNPLGLLAPVPADLVRWCRDHRLPVSFYVSDSWLADWPKAHPVLRLLQRWPMIGRWLGSSILPEPDQIWYCSRYLRGERETIHQSMDSGLSTGLVLPWGLANLDQSPPLPARHFQSASPLSLVYAGQVQPHKGLDLLLEAMAGCRRRHQLRIIGDNRTAHAMACRQLAWQLGLDRQVEWLGPCSPGELPRLLSRLGQVLIVPSRWQEPFSRVVLEGMASGLPVVASRTGGTPEAISSGRTGFLIDAREPRQLTTLLDQLDADRRLAWQVGQKGQEEVRSRFSIEAMVDRLLAGPGCARSGERKDSSRARRVQSLAGSR